MSKIYFSLSFPHETFPKPKFSIATNNLYGIQLSGADVKGMKLGNGNLNKGYKNRFEYGIKTQKGLTSLSLVMNTSVVLPHASWAPAAPAAKEAAKKITEVESDDDHGYRRSHRRLRSSENDDRRTRYEEKAPVRYEPRPEGRRRRPHRDEESDEEDYRRPRPSHREERRRDRTRDPRRRRPMDPLWIAGDNNDVDLGGPEAEL